MSGADGDKALLSAIEERLDQGSARGLAHAVSRAIRDGALRPGDRLPPIRRVATQLALSPTTVSAAWSLLARSGAILTEGRRGTRVADPVAPGAVRYRKALHRQDGFGADFGLDLSTGVPDAELLPSLARAFARLTTAGTPQSYLDEPVLPELLEVLRADWPYPAGMLTVVDGAMDALHQVAGTLLRFGDRVVVEHPCFPALVDLLDDAGAEITPVPVDESGLLPRALAEALAGGPAPAVAVFLQPRAQNPTGVSMSEERGRRLAEVVADAGVLAVEDDSAGAVAAAPAVSLGRWIPERTVHIRSFSKSHGPDLRMAALSGPDDLMRDLLARRQLGQGWSSRVLQRILLSLLTDPQTVAEVAVARDAYAARRTALVTALAGHGVRAGGSDGLNIWVPVHDEAAALVRLAGRGIGVAPGSPFLLLPGDGSHIRVTAGLVRDGHEELARELAAAARTGAWGDRGR
ncbi:aminotransferase class I/II-fold pyridoxal phosphate-dependent enzyme [Streptomyces sp. YIM 98790]|uniref:aminotransferase-like domain-containing protein n=1 Tax=Streptomyces sp. YIM 98790 TaxID=2689077 RepID=UPI001A9E5279|nr:aminotransferase class I/II-fold pyridoxal phosphate-dependent enzyme [Streptomyces sp. YIM 98790]